jgi:hypothetical protein
MFFWVFLVIGYGNLWWFNVEKMMVFGYGWLKGEVLFFYLFGCGLRLMLAMVF